VRTATELAINAHLGLWDAPWAVRQHPNPSGQQHPWLWTCTTPGCRTAGAAVNELDAHGQAADHHTRNHPTGDPA
jgi:hypothetical protein